MLGKLLPYEKGLFFLINGSHTHYLDCTMWLFSGMKIWIPLALFIIFNLVYKKSWKRWVPALLAIVLVFVFCDQFSSHLIKPLFARPRPTHYPYIMEHVKTLFGYKGGHYGFISSHAANSFGFAVFTAFLFRNKLYSIAIFVWATIVSYSRIYLGVHFPSDIIGGMIAGFLIGFFMYKVYRIVKRKMQPLTMAIPLSEYSTTRINLVSYVIIGYIVLFSMLSEFLITLLYK
ncbi:MAG: phosphatase PAP2 family protein [Bacteroides sp.]|jgi:undecaprenyl-diphosphatase|nr:phosphatase PAP2 family protein [Bacteroides sp.]